MRVHVVEAKHLMKKDIGMLGKGKSDPYAVITVGAQEFKTKTIDNTVDPKWDYWCEVSLFCFMGPACFCMPTSLFCTILKDLNSFFFHLS